MNYKDCEIRVVVLPPTFPHGSFRAIYEVRLLNDGVSEPRKGVIAGALGTAAEAEDAAVKAAMHMIDQREQ